MGRGVTENAYIADEHCRRITFKKRRIGLLKKAMQLSLISDCEIEMKVFWKEDNSVIEYKSDRNCISQ